MGLPKTALKAFVLVLNVILFICAAIVMGIGIWAVADKIYISEIIGNNYFSSSAILMVCCGTFLLLVSFLGCAGGISNSRVLIAIYIVIMCIIFILLLTTGIVAAVFHGDIEDKMRETMKRSLTTQYGVSVSYNEDNQRVTDAWDLTQTRLRCCGVDDNSWFLYQQSYWFTQQYMGTSYGGQNNRYNTGNQYGGNNQYGTNNQYNVNVGSGGYSAGSNQKFVPPSCCVYEGNLRQYQNLVNCQSFAYGPPRFNGGAANTALYYKGCYVAAKDYLLKQANIIMGIGFSFMVFLITGIVVAGLFFSSLGSEGGSADFRR